MRILKRLTLIDVNTPPFNARYRSSIDSEVEMRDEEHSSLPLAQRKLRWGAMQFPSEANTLSVLYNDKQVAHLGFGGEEHNVTEPQEGHWYL